jgi:hypothetical protein
VFVSRVASVIRVGYFSSHFARRPETTGFASGSIPTEYRYFHQQGIEMNRFPPKFPMFPPRSESVGVLSALASREALMTSHVATLLAHSRSDAVEMRRRTREILCDAANSQRDNLILSLQADHEASLRGDKYPYCNTLILCLCYRLMGFQRRSLRQKACEWERVSAVMKSGV